MTEAATPLRDRTLITFAVFSYNQERFIREAVEGAFAQTYQPLEIILSDDCSTDRTFEIMREIASAYRGPHRVLLNKNPVNLGVGAHVNRVMELAGGDIVIPAGGDDVSLPLRTQVVADEFHRNGGGLVSLFAAATVIDSSGRETGVRSEAPDSRNRSDLRFRTWTQVAGVFGAAHAWHRRIFDQFGPLRNDVMAEDRPITFRAYELGQIGFIPQPLVKYRVHGNNMSVNAFGVYSPDEHDARCMKKAALRAALCRQFLDDMKNPIFARNHSRSALDDARKAAMKGLRLADLERDFVKATRLQRIGMALRGMAAGSSRRNTLDWLARCVLPEPLYASHMRRLYARRGRNAS